MPHLALRYTECSLSKWKGGQERGGGVWGLVGVRGGVGAATADVYAHQLAVC